MRTKELFQFIQERHLIYQRRAAGKPKPWTKDPILQQYRFTNIDRELDTVTVWIRENWRTPHAKDPYLWFAMVVARLFNQPAMLEDLGYPVPYFPQRIRQVTERRKRMHQLNFNAAYIVSTNGHAMEKVDYLTSKVLGPLWADREAITKVLTDESCTLQDAHALLTEYDGLGSFMAAQVVCDLKYAPVLAKAPDWWTFAAPGPGSIRGMNWVFGRDVAASWPRGEWLAALHKLQQTIGPLVKKAGMPRIHAQGLQNCLCEFDKFERARTGAGRPKQRYQGGE